MHKPSASSLSNNQSFIVSFLNNSRESERDSAAVQQFLSKMEAAFRSHPLGWLFRGRIGKCWRGIRKYIMTKLFPQGLFASLPLMM
ncbi:hypothetical protein Leryth_020437 [Lithospermum erythrorhizon]|nr:hypothetical protein Leryth_020437 [Lithospermum erythrorhizon]